LKYRHKLYITMSFFKNIHWKKRTLDKGLEDLNYILHQTKAVAIEAAW
jgi:hypothetical protein